MKAIKAHLTSSDREITRALANGVTVSRSFDAAGRETARWLLGPAGVVADVTVGPG